MRSQPTAIGYLRSDVSGIRQTWDEAQIRSMARRLGYSLTKTVVFSERVATPVDRLINVVLRTDVDAVLTPSLEHLGSTPPAPLIQVVDLITVDPHATYARWAVLPITRPDDR
ncbi:hypothetical protein [Nocardia sp. NBC_00511]|uniref:hypothetical protein n=1 Tax=Nocardia sp. NBC_00511 TaxID=2903591 RepID=UPI0030E5E18B